jgi:hypothetical protein
MNLLYAIPNIGDLPFQFGLRRAEGDFIRGGAASGKAARQSDKVLIVGLAGEARELLSLGKLPEAIEDWFIVSRHSGRNTIIKIGF